MVEWQESLSIGVLEVDIQHKLLFEKFNDFLTACEARTEADAIYRLFWFVEAYTVTHFGQEEKLMQETAFPGIQKHKELHKNFIAEVGRLKERLKNEGPSPTLISTMTLFISNWLIDHISNMDREIGKHVNAVGVPAVF